MKKIFHITISATILASAMAITSCNDNYEELPADKFTYDYLFSTTDSAGTQAKGFLSPIYDAMKNGHNGYGGYYLDCASDDALPIDMDGNPDVLKLQLGQYTASNRIGSDMRWGDYYSAIRKVNILLSGIDRVPFKETYINALGQERGLGVSMKAEARFLRAYFYFELIKRYGGVPLLGDKVYNITDDMELPRNTFSDCVDYIVSELDNIKDSLRSIPMQNPDLYAHAATKQACMALKSRVLLYAASPLFNGNTLESGNELVGYASYDKARWKEAADAARDFIEQFGPQGSGAFNLNSDFRQTFLSYYQKTSNPELIFYRAGSAASTDVEKNNGPLGFSGNNLGEGRMNPTQNLVDAFPMKDGKPIGKSGKYSYNPQSPYDNRDPRLDWTVLHNGSKWLGGTLQTWQGGTNNPISGDYSTTSYYMSKFMGKFETATEYSNVVHVWVMFRYAEMLLNFAEAENEYLDTPSQEVYNAIIALRARAGIEPGDNNLYGLDANMTQAEMREVIHNERRIEMAFEEQRYFDIRRWREAETIYQSPLRGMNIAKGVGAAVYSTYDVLDVSWENRRYLYPIPYNEVIKNDNMKQNPDW